MKARIQGRLKQLLHGESGQVLQWAALAMVGLIGMCGMTIDAGRAYVAHTQMQNYANAAALAAAWQVYDSNSSTGVTATATTYSASNGNKNYTSSVGTVTTVVSTKCLNVLLPKGSTCSSSSPNNAVVVKQTVTVPMTFMKLFGVSQLSVTATATASMQGAAQPWNVAIILDATGSMGTVDSNCGGITEFKCATNGIQALLAATNPCPAGVTTCTASNSNFHVALFSFPAMSTDTVSSNYNCSYADPFYTIYPLPIPGATSYSPTTYTSSSGWGGSQSFTSTYEVTLGASDADANGFVSNYYSSTSSNHLSSSSSIVKAVSGCMSPIQNLGWGTGALQGAYSGGITYYAGVLYAAQSALTAEKVLFPKAKNAIIFLSDGQANLVASTGDFPTSFTPSPTGSAYYQLTSNGTYPSAKDECQQAIVAAQAATDAGTTVFGVAYGAQQTGCSSGSGATDTSIVATGRNQSFSLNTLTPCVTIENIASSLSYFYSDWTQSSSGVDNSCIDSSHSVVSLQDIFLSIASNFTTPRLLPNSAT